MKAFKLFIFIFCFSLQGLVAQSKASNYNEWLPGFWNLDSLRTVRSVKIQDRTFNSSFEKQDKDRIFSSLGTRTLLLRKDMSFVYTFGNSEWISRMEGKWDTRDSLLILSSPKGDQNFIFERVSNNVVMIETISSHKSLLQQLYFVRKNEK